jgi:hypothetical protein
MPAATTTIEPTPTIVTSDDVEREARRGTLLST